MKDLKIKIIYNRKLKLRRKSTYQSIHFINTKLL